MSYHYFSRFFLSNDRFSAKFDRFLLKFVWESLGRFLEKVDDLSVKSADNSTKPAKVWDSRIRLILRLLHCILAEFF
jgi:hypothetical protein